MPVLNMLQGDGGIRRTQEKQAARLLGRTDLMTWFHETGAQNPPVPPVNGGTATAVPATDSLLMSSGATSGGLSRLYPYSPDGTNFMQLLRAGQPWYIAGRFRVTTTPTTGTILSVGVNNISAHLRIGVDVSNGSATQFMMLGPSGSTMSSGVVFDTALHTFQGWRVGSNTYLQVDSNAVVTGNVDVLLDSGPLAWAGNGTNANQAMELVWWQVSAPSR